ncbi:MAG: hypothetical protein JXJ17_13795 [Anaerolineae bacterium]|jgi:DNA primase large subunit|nr:hypothetical protein [Anaerolineae bacterium]
MRKYPKSIRKAILEWAAEAHERELYRELTLLDRSFTEWRNGEIGSGELSCRVHEYDTGPSRELFKQYNSGFHDLDVASALVKGILTYEEVPAEVIEAIQNLLAFIQRP